MLSATASRVRNAKNQNHQCQPKVPLTNIPIGQPWEMVAVDILQLPLSSQHNKYLLVVQDYFTKWAEAVPLPDQTEESITREFVSTLSHC